MSEDKLAKMKERDRVMRLAREDILRRVGAFLKSSGYKRVTLGHYTRTIEGRIWHVGFQKLSSGRSIRVMCNITFEGDSESSIRGPDSDAYCCPNSPNGIKYWHAWSTRESDKARCTSEFCRYLTDVVFNWFLHPIPAP